MRRQHAATRIRRRVIPIRRRNLHTTRVNNRLNRGSRTKHATGSERREHRSHINRRVLSRTQPIRQGTGRNRLRCRNTHRRSKVLHLIHADTHFQRRKPRVRRICGSLTIRQEPALQRARITVVNTALGTIVIRPRVQWARRRKREATSVVAVIQRGSQYEHLERRTSTSRVKGKVNHRLPSARTVVTVHGVHAHATSARVHADSGDSNAVGCPKIGAQLSLHGVSGRTIKERLNGQPAHRQQALAVICGLAIARATQDILHHVIAVKRVFTGRASARSTTALNRRKRVHDRQRVRLLIVRQVPELLHAANDEASALTRPLRAILGRHVVK